MRHLFFLLITLSFSFYSFGQTENDQTLESKNDSIVNTHFEGGFEEWDKWIHKKVKYPKDAIRMGVEGNVYICFSVDTLGNLINFSEIRGIGAGCTEAVYKALKKSPKWVPATKNGKKVQQNLSYSYKFELN